MTLQNRVLATGDIVAHPARGLFMGNRGILHDERQNLGRHRWRHKAWIICTLKHKNWHRAVMSPNAYTELFFLDEAVAMAAGHRPCTLCRRPAYQAYRKAAGLTGSAKAMDDQLHGERAVPRKFDQRRHSASAASLPDGAIIFDKVPKLVKGQFVYPVTPSRYGPADARPSGMVTVLTPPTSLAALSSGYRPILHGSV
ncbi:MAG: hypothetical protein HKN18_18540 [Silicimonas sp.]|nr:hypothetical protein [Silicimonas sp.]